MPWAVALPAVPRSLAVSAFDPTDLGCEWPHNGPCEIGYQPRGKQSLDPDFIMYSAVTGIWQSVAIAVSLTQRRSGIGTKPA